MINYVQVFEILASHIEFKIKENVTFNFFVSDEDIELIGQWCARQLMSSMLSYTDLSEIDEKYPNCIMDFNHFFNKIDPDTYGEVLETVYHDPDTEPLEEE
jgi:hypothetical protein